MKKGFAVVSVIFLVVALLVLGAGGYTGYRYFTEPDFDFYGLMERGPSAAEVTAKYPVISADLLDHVQGANADLLLFYAKDDALLDYLEPLMEMGQENPPIHAPAFMDPSDVRAALVAFKVVFPEDFVLDESAFNDPEALIDTMSVIVAIDFENNTVAENVSLAALPLAAFVPQLQLDVYDTTFVAQVNPEILEGPVYKNPLIAKMNEAYGSSSDFVLMLNMEQNFAYSVVPFAVVNAAGALNVNSFSSYAPLPAAHAQLISPGDQPGRLAEAKTGEAATMDLLVTSMNSLIPLGTSVGLYAGYDNPEAMIAMELEFLGKEGIEERLEGAAKLTGDSVSDFTGGLSVESFEDQYDQGFTLMDQLLADSPLPEGMNIVRDGTKISGSYTFEPPALDGVIDAPVRARNAARIADINSWIAALEAYAADNGEYPDLSACTEDLSGFLGDYFPSKNLPTDFSGEQTFTTEDESFSITCESGFFYQYFGEGGYAVWAKLEPTSSPLNVGKVFIINQSAWETAGEGPYYASMQTLSSTPGKMVMKGMDSTVPTDTPNKPVQKKGVPRGVKRL